MADLLAHAGHEVSLGADEVPCDLRIVAGPEPHAAPAGQATVVIGSAMALGAPGDVEAAIRAALRAGTVLGVGSPLDARALVSALAESTAAGRAPVPAAPPEAGWLGRSPDPWLILDAGARRLRWANLPAQALLGLRSQAAVEPGAFLPEAVFSRSEGRDRVEVHGRPHLLTWWTASAANRCVGWLGLPVTGPGSADHLAALADIGRATATFAHELRNPLASLAGALDLLAGDLMPPERQEVAVLGRARLQHMQRLLDDTLRFARPLRGQPGPVDLMAIVRSVVDGARMDPQLAGVALRIDAGGDLPPVLGHEQPLHQALTNLVQNAAEAQPHGGSVTVRLDREGSGVVIRVADEGPGIPLAQREQVFTAFWTTKARGTGLGLPFVRRVVEAGGGRAYVEDSPRGACVRLDLLLAG